MSSKENGKKKETGSEITLRPEKRSDHKIVEQITYRAFHFAPPSGGGNDDTEALLAHKLRGSDNFLPQLDYVAMIDGKIVGNIMYTRSKVVNDAGGEWETLTFGPISVLPQYQGTGIGSALIVKTLDIARQLGHRAVLIYGHESYYPRFGFVPASEHGITTADGKNFPAFMALPLYDGALDGVQGRLIYDELFDTIDKEESDRFNEKIAEPMEIDEYIATQPQDIQKELQMVHQQLQATAKKYGMVEKISWGMPTYWKGQNIIHFAAHRSHLGIYPGPEAVEHFKPRLDQIKTSKGAIQIPYKDLMTKHLKLIAEIAEWCAKRFVE